jgi:hypothetical protein
MPKRKVTKEKGSTNRDFFTPDKIIAPASGHHTSQKSPRYCCTNPPHSCFVYKGE